MRPSHLLHAHCLACHQVPEEHVGQVVDLMGQRKAQMVDMTAGRCINRGWMQEHRDRHSSQLVCSSKPG